MSVTTTYNPTTVLRDCFTSTQYWCVKQMHQTVALYESCHFCCKQQFACNLQIDHDVHVIHLHTDETAVKPRKNSVCHVGRAVMQANQPTARNLQACMKKYTIWCSVLLKSVLQYKIGSCISPDLHIPGRSVTFCVWSQALNRNAMGFQFQTTQGNVQF